MPSDPRLFPLILACLPVLSCASLQADDFGQRLDAGCEAVDQCESLLQEATQRANDCRGSIALGCGSADEDLGAATRMLQQAQRRQQGQAQRARRAEREEQGKQWFAEQERQRAAEEQRRQEHIRRRDAVRDERRAEQERRDQHLEHLKQIAKEPEYAVPITNFDICKAKERIAALKDRLAKERELERRSGYAAPIVRRQIALERIETEDKIRKLTERLRRQFQVAPSGCGERYEQLVKCIDTQDRGCEEPLGTVVDILLSGAAEPIP